MEVRHCSRCDSDKPVAEFAKRRKMSHGCNAWCKACHAEYRRENREKRNAYNQKWRQENPGLVQAWLDKTSTPRRLAVVKRKYGLEPDAYRALMQECWGTCMICGEPPPGKRVDLDVDHCHDGGHVRGLLCNPCNMGLGAFRDNPEKMASAIEYLAERA